MIRSGTRMVRFLVLWFPYDTVALCVDLNLCAWFGEYLVEFSLV